MNKHAELIKRLRECTSRVGSMCSDGRPPRMSIPVRDDDDDIFITRTCMEAAAALESESAAVPEGFTSDDIQAAYNNGYAAAKAMPLSSFPELESLVKQGLEDGTFTLGGQHPPARPITFGGCPDCGKQDCIARSCAVPPVSAAVPMRDAK